MRRNDARGILAKVLALLLAVLPLVFINDMFHGVIIPKRGFFQVGFLLSVVLALFLIRTWWLPSGKKGIILLIAALSPIGFSALSLLWAESSYAGIPVVRHWALAAAFFLFPLFLGFRIRHYSWLLLGLVLGGMCVSLIGLAQYYLGYDGIYQAVVPGTTFVNKNFGAHYVALLYPMAAVLGLVAKRTWIAMAFFLIASGMVVLVIIAKTVAAWIAVAIVTVALVVSVLLIRPALWMPRLTALIVMLSVSSGICLFTEWKYSPDDRFSIDNKVEVLIGAARLVTGVDSDGNQKQHGSISGRLSLYAATLSMMKDHPVAGVGGGNLTVHFPRYAETYSERPHLPRHSFETFAHNDFFQFFAEHGLLGLLLLALASYVVCRRLYVLVTGGSDRRHRMVAVACMCTLIAAVVTACFSFPFYRDVAPVVLAVILAYLFSLPVGGIAWRKRVLSLRIRTSLGTVFAALLIAFAADLSRRMEANTIYLKSAYAVRDGDDASVKELTQRTLELDPKQPWALTNAGATSYKEGRMEEALTYFRRVQENFPYATQNLYYLSLALQQTGHYAEAIEALTQRMANLPKDSTARRELSNAYVQYAWHLALSEKDPFGAQRTLDRAEKVDPDNPSIQVIRSRIQSQIRQIK